MPHQRRVLSGQRIRRVLPQVSGRTGKPNIVFLFADQLRATSLPLYGEKQIETPNIDRLAAEG